MKIFITILAFVIMSFATLTVAASDANAEYVRGYYRSNGTYVNGYYRSRANAYTYDNYSYKRPTYSNGYGYNSSYYYGHSYSSRWYTPSYYDYDYEYGLYYNSLDDY